MVRREDAQAVEGQRAALKGEQAAPLHLVFVKRAAGLHSSPSVFAATHKRLSPVLLILPVYSVISSYFLPLKVITPLDIVFINSCLLKLLSEIMYCLVLLLFQP